MMKYRNKDINRMLGLIRLALPIHLTLIFLASFAGLWLDIRPDSRHAYTDPNPARFIVIDRNTGVKQTYDLTHD